MLISELAEKAELHPETIRRLEKRGLIPAAKRDVNGWRQYPPEAVTQLRELYARGDERQRSTKKTNAVVGAAAS